MKNKKLSHFICAAIYVVNYKWLLLFSPELTGFSLSLTACNVKVVANHHTKIKKPQLYYVINYN